jgi:parvulin-like peptidyl-prolyl isomerase
MLLLCWILLVSLSSAAEPPAATPDPVAAVAAEPELVTLATVGGRPITDGQFEFAARIRPPDWSEADARGKLMHQLVDETVLYLKGIEASFGDHPTVRRIMADAIANDERGRQSRTEYVAGLKRGYRVDLDAAAKSLDPASTDDVVIGRVNGQPLRVTGRRVGASRLASKPGPPLDRAKVVDEAIETEILVQEAKKIGYLDDYRVVRAIVQQYRIHLLGLDVRIPDEALRARYDRDPADFGIAERRHVLRLVVSPNEKRNLKKTKALVANLHKQLARHPEEFEDIAGIYTEDKSSRKRNGDLGWVEADGRVGVPQATIDAAFTMRAGQLSPAREVDGRFEVLLVRDVKPAVIRPFEQVVIDVEGAVRSETEASRYEGALAILRAQYEVRIDEPLVARQPLPPTRRRR